MKIGRAVLLAVGSAWLAWSPPALPPTQRFLYAAVAAFAAVLLVMADKVYELSAP